MQILLKNSPKTRWITDDVEHFPGFFLQIFELLTDYDDDDQNNHDLYDMF